MNMTDQYKAQKLNETKVKQTVGIRESMKYRHLGGIDEGERGTPSVHSQERLDDGFHARPQGWFG